jgi:ATP-dependent helicase Lhr and Lhr-like helicase
VLRDGVPLAWYDRRSFHLVTFPATFDDPSWTEALADQVRAGRLRKVELRKVDGDALTASPVGTEVAAAAKAAGFTDGYRGLVFQSR